ASIERTEKTAAYLEKELGRSFFGTFYTGLIVYRNDTPVYQFFNFLFIVCFIAFFTGKDRQDD
ncbi:MAG: hypothetical protein AAFU74_16730, partial [Bacteroidota bacterium]